MKRTIKHPQGGTINLTYATENAAFEDYADEHEQIMQRVYEEARVHPHHREGLILDTNGNTVGTWQRIR